ncbi:hypothetical protein M406DRAFT_75536 [Cryphonectria parasitica EP155]|uniref:Transcription factor domain-containing protein n=1 Tax=Cryphonectria parasitica (strain ATCC 38755 / EP155) TaxID=660469 RepID=A0A9P4Y7K6_CRYP1|nr:uncharacterized protein M406DRAFT_75536 [Cryphonectria parasitica EP155]KAF3768196.1 hypothetical protein M406DRAFT_75536 [Cryphonectria parasitica EP155]
MPSYYNQHRGNIYSSLALTQQAFERNHLLPAMDGMTAVQMNPLLIPNKENPSTSHQPHWKSDFEPASIQRYVKAYETHIQSVYPLFPPKYLDRIIAHLQGEVEAGHYGPETAQSQHKTLKLTDCLTNVQALLVLALGNSVEIHHSFAANKDNFPGIRYFSHAIAYSCFGFKICKPSTSEYSYICAHILASLYYKRLGKPETGFRHIRLAQDTAGDILHSYKLRAEFRIDSLATTPGTSMVLTAFWCSRILRSIVAEHNSDYNWTYNFTSAALCNLEATLPHPHEATLRNLGFSDSAILSLIKFVSIEAFRHTCIKALALSHTNDFWKDPEQPVTIDTTILWASADTMKCPQGLDDIDMSRIKTYLEIIPDNIIPLNNVQDARILDKAWRNLMLLSALYQIPVLSDFIMREKLRELYRKVYKLFENSRSRNTVDVRAKMSILLSLTNTMPEKRELAIEYKEVAEYDHAMC